MSSSQFIYRCLMLVLLAHLVDEGLSQTSRQPLSTAHHDWLDRITILHGSPANMHLAIKPVTRRSIADLIIYVDSTAIPAPQDRRYIQWLADQHNDLIPIKDQGVQTKTYVDSTKTFYTLTDGPDRRGLSSTRSRQPLLKHFYKTPAHFYEVNTKDFYLRVNPLLNFSLAKANDDNSLLFLNQRGIRFHGGIDGKVYFHTEILESQARYPDYVRSFQQRFSAVPGAGFFKTYRSRLFDFDGGVDYLLAKGYLGASISKHVQIELGHGRHFIGHGMRSLFLSDFSTDYFYLKLNTEVWKFQYQNIFGELLRPGERRGDVLLPKKYFAAHYLGLNLSSNLRVGLFETVVFARENQFELQYLNPIILYRTVEGAIGSPDNVLVGIDVTWHLFQRASLYGQFILDEFKISEIGAGDGWWANKYGLQLGAKYLDLFGISNLDAQVEYNVVRPYTYSHSEGIANYSHYNQPLAHPLGANFREGIVKLTYQTKNWQWRLRAIAMTFGEDRDSLNFGGNVLVPNEERVADYGNRLLQGVEADVNLIALDVSYEVRHGLYLDFIFQTRSKESALQARDNRTTYLGGGVRWNLARRRHDF